jgi:hypothetical protein
MKIISIVFILCVWASCSSALANQRFERLQSVYERETERIEDEFRGDRLLLPQRHITALRNLMFSLHRENNIGGMRAVEDALQRFVLDPTPRGLLAASVNGGIAGLQDSYKEGFQAAAARRYQRLEALTDNYRTALTRLQNELSREGDVDGVQVVSQAVAHLGGGRSGQVPELIIDLGF